MRSCKSRWRYPAKIGTGNFKAIKLVRLIHTAMASMSSERRARTIKWAGF
jgi:hypothetical protein